MKAPGNDSLLTEINVTPLVDVVLVLLILMMVTATTLAAKTIPVDLPKAASGEASPKRPLTIAIDPDGAMFVEQERVDDETLRARARGAESAVLAADGRARHESVVHALELLRSEQVGKIALSVRDTR